MVALSIIPLLEGWEQKLCLVERPTKPTTYDHVHSYNVVVSAHLKLIKSYKCIYYYLSSQLIEIQAVLMVELPPYRP